MSNLYCCSFQVRNANFYPPCETGGAFPDPATTTWPSCLDPTCDTLPTITGFSAAGTNMLPIYAGGVAYYQCDTAGQVVPTGALMEVPCLGDGTFDVPDPLPTCAAPVQCTIASAPAAGIG